MLPRRYHIFAMPSLQNNTQRTIHILQEDFMVLSVTATSLDLAIAKAKEELKLFRAYATSNLKVQDYTCSLLLATKLIILILQIL